MGALATVNNGVYEVVNVKWRGSNANNHVTSQQNNMTLFVGPRYITDLMSVATKTIIGLSL